MTAFLTFSFAHFDSDQYGAPKHSPHGIEDAVGGKRELVGFVAEQREPARLRHHQIENVAVNDQITPAVDAVMDGVLHDFDAAEMRAVVASQKFVVIAGDIDDPGTLAGLP